MAIQLGATAPEFEADKTERRINFHDLLGESGAILFSHPSDRQTLLFASL
jgi:alkyl hydroperoxide reductase subunit AhpC